MLILFLNNKISKEIWLYLDSNFIFHYNNLNKFFNYILSLINLSTNFLFFYSSKLYLIDRLIFFNI